VKERLLKGLTRQTIPELFGSRKWTFYVVDQDRKVVKIEAPVSSSECYVVELAFKNESELTELCKFLRENGIIETEVRFVPD
jgi:hypothetical protein